MRVLTPDQYRRMPWKNGHGETTEIARVPRAHEPGDDFDWRVSIAGVERDGPFSRFPGIDRILVVLEGEGLILERADGTRTPLGPLAPCTFCGDDETAGRLIGGPIRDFNVMTRRGVARARLEVFAGSRVVAAAAGPGSALLYCLAGGARVRSGREDAVLAAGSTALVDAPAGLVRIEPAASGSTLLGVFVTSEREAFSPGS